MIVLVTMTSFSYDPTQNSRKRKFKIQTFFLILADIIFAQQNTIYFRFLFFATKSHYFLILYYPMNIYRAE